ncbi:MAG: NAD(P)H-hydrate dehydratase [Chitinophagaceae bacterium]
MKIFSAGQIRKWDQRTMQHEPISSIALMERAAGKCVQWLFNNFANKNFKIFCGKGNNGGDGLAIARLLSNRNLHVEVYILESGKPGTDDFQTNLQRLLEISISIHNLQLPEQFPSFEKADILIDAIYGSGLNKPLEGLSKELVLHINSSKNKVISIDVPSGLFIDESSVGNTIIEADHTLSFQTQKLGLLLAENSAFIGQVHILDIGLHPDFTNQEESDFYLIDLELISNIFKPRKPFAHKGNYGHGLIIGGSYGKIGAVLLATKACLAAGAGLTTTYLPACGYEVLQTTAPEAMVLTDKNENLITTLPSDVDKYNAIGIGPGLETTEETQKAVVEFIFLYKKPIVIDADGLNCLVLQKEDLTNLTPYSILTPHPKEFERLFGECKNDFERITVAKQKAKELNVVIVLKGHHTFIATPTGQGYFNNTGNAGMAKGGSGDALTGIITSFLSQQYKPVDAAILGVYIHGLAGDIASENLSKESMLATDIINYMAQAFKLVNKQKELYDI